MRSNPLPPTAYYFGCHTGPGHYLHAPGMRSAPWHDPFVRLDGQLAPEGPQTEFIAQPWRLRGYSPAGWRGCSALSWWDRTVDARGGSNSILFAPGLTVTAEGMIDLLQELFPAVTRRMPTLTLLPDFRERRR